MGEMIVTRLLIVFLALIGLAACQAPQDRAYAILAEAAERGDISGAQSLRVGDDEPVRLLAEGVDEASRFRLASLSKIFTQIALLRLADQGELNLDQSLSSLRPGLTADWAEVVSVRQLLNFSSGLPRDLDDETGGVRFDATGHALAFMDAQGHLAPDYTPGTRTRYSNLGYMHLGAVIEAVTGQTYADAIDALVIRPASLVDTGFGVDHLGQGRHLNGYEGDPLVLVSDHPIAQRYSTGGLHGSIRDLELLSREILNPGFLSDAAQREFFTQFGRPDARDPSYVLATGHVPGFTHAWLIAREPALAIVSLNNRVEGELRQIPDVITRSGAVLYPAIAERSGRYRPVEADGWITISDFDQITDQPILPKLSAMIEAVLSGDTNASRDATMRLHGYEPDTASASDLEDFAGFTGAYVRIAADFGPFHPIAWRMDGERLQIYLESADGQRGIHFAAAPSEADPTVTDSLSLGTYGFEP